MSLSACWKTGQNPCKNKHGENCIAQVGCWYFVRLCGAAGVGCEVSDEKIIQTYPDSNCTFHHQNSQRKQTNFTVPTDLIENFGQHNLLHVSLSACWKTGQNPCKNKHGENCIAQVVCWYFVRLCGAAGVGGEVSDEKKQSQHIQIRTAFSTTRIHKENKQVLPYQPTLLKTLTNIIYCMCLFQHVGKQDRTHVRTHMVKIAHISYVHILSAYVVCIFYLLFGVLATLVFFLHILSVT